ncbi:carbohydrate kinase family protein [Paremcibacter congregatus]|uniref:carbohydrate kinase family protein n=1 Tax=Paremcibacter congregatus TaxID=2043170 RepID=UPI003A91B54C
MRPVFCFGELLIDFLSISEHQSDGLTLKDYRQYPGGAPANAAVAVAKLGGKSYFAGQVGSGIFGDFLKQALERYGVDTRFLLQHPTAKTALAFVERAPDGDRRFSFYRHETADLLMTPEQVDNAWFADPVIFHFCSNTLTTDAITTCTHYAVDQALSQNNLISFDVNLRHNLWPDGHADKDRVNSLVYKSHVVKFSRDELEYLASGDLESYIREALKTTCQLILVTDGGNIMSYHTASHSGEISPPPVDPVDTTAGGDAFIGGFLHAISRTNDPFAALVDRSKLPELLMFALCCGACTVTKAGAFPALPDLNEANSLFTRSFPDASST